MRALTISKLKQQLRLLGITALPTCRVCGEEKMPYHFVDGDQCWDCVHHAGEGNKAPAL